MQARSRGQAGPLEEEMATHSSILAWRIPTDGGARRAAVHGVTKSWTRLSSLAHVKQDISSSALIYSNGVFSFSVYDFSREKKNHLIKKIVPYPHSSMTLPSP